MLHVRFPTTLYAVFRGYLLDRKKLSRQKKSPSILLEPPAKLACSPAAHYRSFSSDP